MFIFLREVVPSRGASLGFSVIPLCKAEASIPPSLYLCLAHHAVCEWTAIAYRHGSRCHDDEGHPGRSHTWQAPPMAICNPQSCILIHLELAFPWCQRIFIFKFPTHVLPRTHYFNETRLGPSQSVLLPSLNRSGYLSSSFLCHLLPISSRFSHTYISLAFPHCCCLGVLARPGREWSRGPVSPLTLGKQ